MALLAGVYKPAGEASNFPGSFQLKTYGPGGRYLLTETTDPDCSGIYTYTGEHNGLPYYTLAGGGFVIWKHAVDALYIISIALDHVAAGHWSHDSALGIPGAYAPTAPYTGNPSAASNTVSVVRLRVAGRRGGSGSPPGLYHGSPAQAIVRQIFTARMKAYANAPAETEAWIEGTPLPDVTGWYRYHHDINFLPALYSITTEFYIWWYIEEHWWLVSQNPPNLPDEFAFWWRRIDDDPIGLYEPQDMAVNDLLVTDEP